MLTGIGNLIAGLCLLVILLIILSEIICRNLLGISLSFAWDYAAYLMGIAFLFSAASAMKNGGHVRVTALTEALPLRLARLLDIIACVIGFACCVALASAMTDMALVSLQRGSTSSTVLRTPLIYPQAALAIGAVLLAVQCFAQFLRLLRGEALAIGEGIE